MTSRFLSDRRVDVALIQVASPPDESIAERRRRVGQLVLSAADANVIVLPELWAVGYLNFDDYEAAAESSAGTTLTDAVTWARETNSFIHVGSFVERSATGALRNTAVLVDPSGEVVHRYSKIHVFGYQSREAELLEAGETLSAVDTALGRMSATTCYDLRFPGLWNTLSITGPDVVIVPAAWPLRRLSHWQLFTSVRAVEGQTFVIACNATGIHADTELGGHSRIVDPWGEVLVEAGTDEGVTRCTIDLAVVTEVRQEFPVLEDRLVSYRDLINAAPKEENL